MFSSEITHQNSNNLFAYSCGSTLRTSYTNDMLIQKRVGIEGRQSNDKKTHLLNYKRNRYLCMRHLHVIVKSYGQDTYTRPKKKRRIKHTLHMGEVSPISRKRFVTV